MGDAVQRVLGAAVMLCILADVFLTVLYARMGTSFLASRVARAMWKAFRLVADPLPLRRRSGILSYCGPAILVAMVLTWTMGLILGAALVIHPALGTGVVNPGGGGSRDFVTAIYAGCSSLSIVGSGSFIPTTAGYRLLFTATSVCGASVLSLTLTYLMQVYSALRERNVLGLKLHLLSGETADAAEVVAGLGAEGNFSPGYTLLAEMGAELVQAKEAHHFYPVLFFFRFHEPYYSVSRFTLVSLDVASVIRSALHEQEYGWLMESAPVTQIWRAGLKLAVTLEATFLPGGAPEHPTPPDEEQLALWRRRYRAALRRLRQAGIRTTEDEDAGEALYLELRQQWCPHIAMLAPEMAYGMDEIDLVMQDPEAPDDRPPFRGRRHAAG